MKFRLIRKLYVVTSHGDWSLYAKALEPSDVRSNVRASGFCTPLAAVVPSLHVAASRVLRSIQVPPLRADSAAACTTASV